MNKLIIICISFLVVIQFSCNDTNTKQKKVTTSSDNTNNIKHRKIMPVFNADSAYLYVKQQVAFGPRVPNTAASMQCADFLKKTLSRYCDTVYIQNFKTYSFDNTILNGQNIIGSFKPSISKRLFLSAHWDSRPFADNDSDPKKHKTPIDGANDGASGVGILLEIARLLSFDQPDLGIDIILFDIEDYGAPQDYPNQHADTWGLGSQYWSKNPHTNGYQARFGILLDMVGDANATFPIEGFSNHYAKDIVQKVWNSAEKLGYGTSFIKSVEYPITDDHYYINTIAKIPTIDIIHLKAESQNGSFVDYWHTTKDNLSNINPETLKMVGEVVLHVIYEE